MDTSVVTPETRLGKLNAAVIFSASGAGRATQRRAGQEYVCRIFDGDMLRENIAAGTPLG